MRQLNNPEKHSHCKDRKVQGHPAQLSGNSALGTTSSYGTRRVLTGMLSHSLEHLSKMNLVG